MDFTSESEKVSKLFDKVQEIAMLASAEAKNKTLSKDDDGSGVPFVQLLARVERCVVIMDRLMSQKRKMERLSAQYGLSND